MLNFIIEVVFWCLCVYGLMTFIKDIVEGYTYKNIKKNVKIILTVKNVENGIENYIRELRFGKNFYNNLVVIDLDSQDNTVEVLKELEKECINMKILDREQGIGYMKKILTPVE